ncbi:Arc family DNA-binding protein [Serratia rhizosphaerae]|uniref:Arc family DNA-binding protein n=1 Tax=unclassified Serratia (in: enterobacteria) TaxID=2647522 RepID=UPI00164EB33D|nr:MULTISPECIES: Arc family DNA-binding protein [unclassified Serratia (in: enterobacteria)]QNK34574.1 Arc family DNA-binding protein [Serratia sp. JUb9]CAE1146462.1 Arc domain-containing protein [Serratia sp. Tan611]
MSEISTLTIKIPLELKEKVRAAALAGECSLSAEVCQRLADSFTTPAAGQKKAQRQAEIDSQETTEVVEAPLSQKELRKLRQLLKINVKSGKKK